MRPVDRSEFGRFDALLEEHHWLGRGLVGETLRHVGVIDGEWVALVGYGSPALTLTARDRWIGWSPEARYRRLRFVANNQRFCVLRSCAPKNLASGVLGASLRRLSGDWEDAWGHPIVLVETFTDPARHRGTCYQAANFEQVGTTSGWRRSSGSYVYHGTQKAVWLRAIRRGAASILSDTFDHPVIAKNPRKRPIVSLSLGHHAGSQRPPHELGTEGSELLGDVGGSDSMHDSAGGTGNVGQLDVEFDKGLEVILHKRDWHQN